MYPQAPQATVRVLERLGHQVFFPPDQVCCGQMHVNTGYLAEALPVVKEHVRTFSPVLTGAWDAIVAPSGSCTGSIRHQQGMVARRYGENALAADADAVAARTYELSELLVDVLGVTDVGAYFPHHVTYHPTCHSLRMLHVGDKPVRLLRAVEGIRLTEVPTAGDYSCLMHIGGGLSRTRAGVRTMHLAEILAAEKSTGGQDLGQVH